MNLRGARILVVEDEAIIAFGLEDMLMSAGAEVVLACCLDEGAALLEGAAFDLAILDVNLKGVKSYPLAAALQQRAVPFLFATGYGRAEHPPEFAAVPTITKPYAMADIDRACAALEEAGAD